MPSLIYPNRDFTAVASGVRVITGNSDDFNNRYWKGIRIRINVTAVSGTVPVLVVSIQLKNPIVGDYVSYVSTPDITAISAPVLLVTPYTPSSADLIFQDAIAQTWRVSWTIAGVLPSFTFSVGGLYMP